jgi:hypothetical protein
MDLKENVNRIQLMQDGSYGIFRFLEYRTFLDHVSKSKMFKEGPVLWS